MTVLIKSADTLVAYISDKNAWMSHRQAPRIERDDLVVESGEAELVFADQSWLETALPIAGQVLRQGTASARSVLPPVPFR